MPVVIDRLADDAVHPIVLQTRIHSYCPRVEVYIGPYPGAIDVDVILSDKDLLPLEFMNRSYWIDSIEVEVVISSIRTRNQRSRDP